MNAAIGPERGDSDGPTVGLKVTARSDDQRRGERECAHSVMGNQGVETSRLLLRSALRGRCEEMEPADCGARNRSTSDREGVFTTSARIVCWQVEVS